MAESGVYVIGVDVDEYETTFEGGAADGSEFLLTSMLKSTSKAVQFAIQCFLFRFEDCAGRTNLLSAANRGIDLAVCHEACDVFNGVIQRKVADLFRGKISDGARKMSLIGDKDLHLLRNGVITSFDRIITSQSIPDFYNNYV